MRTRNNTISNAFAPIQNFFEEARKLLFGLHGLERFSIRRVFVRLPIILAAYYIMLGLGIASPLYNFLVVPGDIRYGSLKATELFPPGYPAKDVMFRACDGSQLCGILLSPKNPNGKLILFSHGNMCSVIDSTEDLAKELVAKGYTLLVYDYRGYGNSEGERTMAGILDDGLSAYDAAVTQLGFSPEQIIVMGESLGSAASCNIASHRKVKSLVLLSAFTSIPDIVRSKLNIYPDWIFQKPYLNNLEMAKKITCPILAVCGRWDALIPNEHSRLITKAASGPAKFLLLPHTGHTVELNGLDRELLNSELLAFLKLAE